MDDTYLGDVDLTSEYRDKLLTQRDNKMAEKIKGYLQDESGKTYLIIVGAGHYISPTYNGVVDQLEKSGYTITQIK